MSISSVGSSMNADAYSDMLAKVQEARKEGGREEFVSSIIQENDGNGDGYLTAKETGLNGSIFKSVDISGDGLISPEEMAAGIEKLQQQKGMMGATALRLQEISNSPQANVSVNKTSSKNDEKSIDINDLNEDGVVSTSEFLQAFEAGDQSLADVVGKINSSEKKDGKSTLTQKAISAYQAQSVGAGVNPLGLFV